MMIIDYKEQRLYLFLQGTISPGDLSLLQEDMRDDKVFSKKMWLDELIVEAVCKRAVRIENMKQWDNEMKIEDLESSLTDMRRKMEEREEEQKENWSRGEPYVTIENLKREIENLHKENNQISQQLTNIDIHISDFGKNIGDVRNRVTASHSQKIIPPILPIWFLRGLWIILFTLIGIGLIAIVLLLKERIRL